MRDKELSMEIEVLDPFVHAPRGVMVVTYLAQDGGALLCMDPSYRPLFLPRGSFRLLRAWRGETEVADPMHALLGWFEETDRRVAASAGD